MSSLFVQIRDAVNLQINTFLEGKDSNVLTDEIKRTILSGGKRIRPVLLGLAHMASGGKDTMATPVAVGVALEFLHTTAIIHDDIMDHSVIRRTCDTTYGKYGEGVAIIVGDLCFSYAQELFYSMLMGLSASNSVKYATIAQWRFMQEEIMIGQYLDISVSIYDVLAMKKPDWSILEKQVLKISDLKTARYTVERPLLLGACLAGASDKLKRSLSIYGRNVGIAYQIQDDILGMFGDEKVLGKPVDSDLKEGKLTILTLLLLKRLEDRSVSKKQLADIDWVRNKMISNGVLEDCIKRAQEHVAIAQEAIGSSDFQSSFKKQFLEIADNVIARSY